MQQEVVVAVNSAGMMADVESFSVATEVIYIPVLTLGCLHLSHYSIGSPEADVNTDRPVGISLHRILP